jgi:hypothetical protein
MRKHDDQQFCVIHPSPARGVPPRASALAGRVVKPGARYAHTRPFSVDDDITRIPTLPERHTPHPRSYDLANVKTVPPHVSPDISKQDTIEHASSIYSQYMDGTKNSSKRPDSFILTPLERVRWWLLYPGRLEFLLLAGGTLLLLGITTLLVLLMAVSLGIID